MLRFWALLFGCLFIVAGWHSPARASADMGCQPVLKPSHAAFSGCDNMALLQPGNDTRVNLILLLRERRGAKPTAAAVGRPEPLNDWRSFRDALHPHAEEGGGSDYADGEGSRCRSNDEGAAAFGAAVASAKKVPAAEKSALIAARGQLRPDCIGEAEAPAIAEAVGKVLSSQGKEFASYLRGAAAFYDGDFTAASSEFRGLSRAAQPWLREAARYMGARVEVNRAQVGAFDEYGAPVGPEHVDQQVIDAGEAALLAYLRDYPRGRYATSARGLLRRVYWLGGRTAKLAAQYQALFALDPDARGLSDAELAEEIDTKLLPNLKPEDSQDPLLLAVYDLREMRMCDDSDPYEVPCDQPISQAQVEAQRQAFAREPRLFELLLAIEAFHDRDDAEAVLRLIPGAEPSSVDGTIGFSRAVLRKLALERLGRGSEAEWLALLPRAVRPFERQAAELALAYHHERAGTVARLFEHGSPVGSPTLREQLLIYVADRALLRQQAQDVNAPAHERQVALFTLLYRDLSHRAYRDFLTDRALIPAGAPTEGYFGDLIWTEQIPVGIFAPTKGSQDYGCPVLHEVVAALDRNPADAKALLCLGDFLRLNGFDQNELDHRPTKNELGGTPSRFSGKSLSRQDIYQRVIADPKAPAADKAYALYRAVWCYGPSGNNSCGGDDVDVSQRKAWFTRLKKDYPSSRWAKALDYYW